MATIQTMISVAACLSLLSCDKKQEEPDTRAGSDRGAAPKQTHHLRNSSEERVDSDALMDLAKTIPDKGEMGEDLRSLIGSLKTSLQESGDYAGAIKVLMALPRSARHLALIEFRGVTSPLRAEDELAGRLLLVTEVTGIEARTNSLLPDFFSQSSAMLPELRRSGIKNPTNQAMLGPVYLDLARTRPDAVLGELEQDRALWDTGPATERVVESLLALDSRNAGALIESLPASPTKDTAIVSLCRWMKSHGETEGLAAWIGLVTQEKLKEQLSTTHLARGAEE